MNLDQDLIWLEIFLRRLWNISDVDIDVTCIGLGDLCFFHVGEIVEFSCKYISTLCRTKFDSTVFSDSNSRKSYQCRTQEVNFNKLAIYSMIFCLPRRTVVDIA